MPDGLEKDLQFTQVTLNDDHPSIGIATAELAARAGTSNPTVSRYENGLVDPRAETLVRLLHACGRELQAQPAGLPSSTVEIAERFERASGPTADGVTRQMTENHRRLCDALRQMGTPRLRAEGVGDEAAADLSKQPLHPDFFARTAASTSRHGAGLRR